MSPRALRNRCDLTTSTSFESAHRALYFALLFIKFEADRTELSCLRAFSSSAPRVLGRVSSRYPTNFVQNIDNFDILKPSIDLQKPSIARIYAHLTIFDTQNLPFEGSSPLYGPVSHLH